MKTLIIDTSHRYLAVGLAVDGVLKASQIENLHKQQSEYLVPFIQNVLKQADVEISEIDEMVVCDGPGSYTGMRIGITFVKSIAMVFPHIKVFKVNTLLSLSGLDSVFAFIDARSGRTFGAFCDHGVIRDERVYMIDEVLEIKDTKVGDLELIEIEQKDISILENILSVRNEWIEVANVDVLVPRYLK